MNSFTKEREATGLALKQIREERDLALKQSILKARSDLTRKASLPSGLDPDALLRTVQAEATRLADSPIGSSGTAIGNVLPQTARKIAGLRVCNWKVWEVDLKPIRIRKGQPDRKSSYANLKAKARIREKGDPLVPIIVSVGVYLLYAERKAGTGFARLTFEQIGKGVGCCKETARKVVRFLQNHRWIDTFNVLTRVHGLVRRGPNLYVIPAGEPDCDLPRDASPVERLRWHAGRFGLVARALGLNATSAPVGYGPAQGRPAPS